MVVLGAGASYDAVNESVMSYDSNWRPPLTIDLFQNRPVFNSVLLEMYPQAIPVAQHLRERLDRPQANLEAELASLIEQSKRYQPLVSELLAARFYIQWVISEAGKAVGSVGMTNYASLVRKLDIWRHGLDEPVLYVTFNYDTLIEDAFRSALGMRMSSLAEYVSSNRAKLVKLHGSVHWYREITVEIARSKPVMSKDELRTAVIEQAADLQVSDDVTVMYVPGRVQTTRGRPEYTPNLLYPAIAVPVEAKPRYECPSSHLQALTELLPSVDRVLTIGWKGQEEGFLELMRTHLPANVHGHVVGNDPTRAEAVRQHLEERTGITQWTGVSHGGFSSFVRGEELSNLLELRGPVSSPERPAS